jgi:hypothetical protein
MTSASTLLLRRLLFLSLPALAVAGACVGDTVFPGDLVVGTFDFQAQADWARSTCDAGSPDLKGASDGGFPFSGTFSRDSVKGEAWFTIDGFSRKATYTAEAQRFITQHRARAKLSSCDESCEDSEIEETMSVVVLSDSQDRQLGSRCSNLATDGGLPAGPEVTPPGPTLNGYDAERACGELKVQFHPGQAAGCRCQPACSVMYKVEGKRRFND